MAAKVGNILMWLALLAGLAAGIYGFFDRGMPFLPSRGVMHTSVLYFWPFLLAICFFVVLVGRLFRLSPLVACGILAVAASILFNQAMPMLVTLVFFTASAAAGHRFLKILGVDSARLPGASVVLLGAALFGFLTAMLSHWPINYAGLYAILMAIPIWMERDWLRVHISKIIHSARTESTPHPILDTLIAVGLLLCLLLTFLPDIGADSNRHHLLISSYVKMNRFWHFDRFADWTAALPAMADRFYTIGYLFADQIGAKSINFGFSILMLLSLRDLIHALNGDGFGVRWAVLLSLSLPMMLLFNAASLYVELVWAAYAIAGFLAVIRIIVPPDGSDDIRRANLVAGGGLLGAMIAVKLQGATLLLALFPVLLLGIKTWARRGMIRATVIGLVLFLVLGGFTYLENAWTTGNPVYPFSSSIFGVPKYDFQKSIVGAWAEPLTWKTVYNATFWPEKYIEGYFGCTGFPWLVLGPGVIAALFFRPDRKKFMTAWAAVASIAFSFLFVHCYIRYMIPSALVFLGLTGVWISDQWAYRKIISDTPSKRRYFHSVAIMTLCLVVTAGNLLYTRSTHWVRLSWNEMTNTNERFKQEIKGGKGIGSILNVLNASEDKKVFFANGGPTYQFYGDYQEPFFAKEIAQRQGHNISTGQGLADYFADNNFGYVVIRENRMTHWPVSSITKPVLAYDGYALLKFLPDSVFRRDLLASPTSPPSPVPGWFESATGKTWPMDTDLIVPDQKEKKIYLFHNLGTLKEGTQCLLTFTHQRTIKEQPSIGLVTISGWAANKEYNPIVWKPFTVKEKPNVFRLEFTVDKTTRNAKLSFQIRENTSSMTLSDISLKSR